MKGPVRQMGRPSAHHQGQKRPELASRQQQCHWPGRVADLQQMTSVEHILKALRYNTKLAAADPQAGDSTGRMSRASASDKKAKAAKLGAQHTRRTVRTGFRPECIVPVWPSPHACRSKPRTCNAAAMSSCLRLQRSSCTTCDAASRRRLLGLSIIDAANNMLQQIMQYLTA